MFKMLEIVGSSPESFSRAVREAVERLLSQGEKIHFFEVKEQRGAVRNNKLQEFQVKLKVAVELEKTEKAKDPSSHVCPTCQQLTDQEGHLCVPHTPADKKCDWCGALIPDERHLCNPKVKELAYICNSCGRSAIKAEYLCHPTPVKEK